MYQDGTNRVRQELIFGPELYQFEYVIGLNAATATEVGRFHFLFIILFCY